MRIYILEFLPFPFSQLRMQIDKCIILSDRPGQLGNLLFLYAHFAAYCLKNNVFLYNPAFSEHAQEFKLKTGNFDYDDLLKNGRFLNFSRANFILKILRKTGISTSLFAAYSISNGRSYDLDSDLSISSARNNFIAGWLYRGEKNVERFKVQIRSMFQLSARNAELLESYIEAQFLTQGVNVGVHIRQGDYAGFEGGRYYFTSEEYAEFMKRTVRFLDMSKVRFHICSNIEQEISDFDGLDVSLSKGKPVIDMYTLSKCDLVLGPPSTFTLWGSFMTEVPIVTLKKNSEESMEDQLSQIVAKFKKA